MVLMTGRFATPRRPVLPGPSASGCAQRRVVKIEREVRQHADPGQRRQLDRQLQHALTELPGQCSTGGSNQGAARSAMR